MAFLTEAANRGSISTGYDIENSSVWEPELADQAYRSQGSTAGTRTKQTFSVWLKRTELGGDQYIFEGGTGNANDTQFGIQFSNSNKIQVMRGHTNGGYQYLLNTNRLFRDTSAWYHIVVAIDTTLGTADNRVRLYVNGVEETSFANRNNPSQNDNLGTFAANAQTSLGVSANLGKHIAAYIAHPALVYNAQLPPTDFGEFDEDSGIWKPMDLSNVTFGTYGYWLKNETSNQMYNDSSGNSNNFARWDSTIYQSTDTPTNNFAVLNFNHRNSGTSGFSNNPILTEGATVHTSTLADYWQTSIATIGVTSGKWYFEAKIQDSNTTLVAVGMGDEGDIQTWGVNNGYLGAGKSLSYGSGSSAYTHSNIIGIAVDVDNGKVYWAKDNTYINSGNPAGNANGTAIPTGGVSNGTYFLGVSGYKLNGHAVWQVNFGGYTAMSISSAASDANGYGTFEYAPPSGFYALCSKNLAEYG